MQPGLGAIEAAAETVYAVMPPTPQYRWPQICARLGVEVWLKHENHTPIGAFKLRGGLVYFAQRAAELADGVITATRGNHDQSLGFAAARHGIPAVVVVPRGNSAEKNAAMRGLGVELVVHGDDFQAAREHAEAQARRRNLHLMPAFHPLLVTGVATYSRELLTAVADIDVAYVPIGLGSGICGMLAVRDALGLKTRIVGVVSAHASAYARSFEAGVAVTSPATTALADGMACRVPEPAALEIIRRGVERIVEVTDDEIADAMRLLFECTHNVAEGAGAAALAAVAQERGKLAGRRVAAVLSGGNVDRDVFASVLTSGSG